jgi:hypothetical protein
VNTDALVRDVAPTIAWLDPSSNPLTTLLVRARGKSRKVTNPMFEMLEQRRPTETATTNATAASTTTATTISVVTDNFLMAGDLVMNTTTEEVMLISSIASNVLTVVRAIGGDIGAVASGATLLRIGNAQPENSSAPDLLSRNLEIPYNYIQIQRRNWGLSNTAMDTANYGAKDQQVRNRENSIEHAIDLEKQLLFGKRDIQAATTFPRRMSGGVLWYLDQSGSGAAISAALATLTLAEVDSWAEDLFRYDGGAKLVLCGARALTAFTVIARNGSQIRTVPGGRKFGLQIREFVTAHGVLNLVYHRLMGRLTDYTGHAIGLTMKNLRLAYQGARRTRLWRNQQTNDVDGVEHGLLSATGLELLLTETHGYMSGITGGA